MVIVIMNLFIFGKPAPSFFFSESIPPPRSQEAKAFFLRENENTEDIWRGRWWAVATS